MLDISGQLEQGNTIAAVNSGNKDYSVSYDRKNKFNITLCNSDKGTNINNIDIINIDNVCSSEYAARLEDAIKVKRYNSSPKRTTFLNESGCNEALFLY